MIRDVARRVLPRPVIQQLKQALRGWGLLDRNIANRYCTGPGEKKLHVGCGTNVLPGWLNTDAAPVSREVMRLDATRPFPLPGDTFAYVFSEHMIEHVPYRHGLAMLAECFRVMMPGGRIRISTPDLGFLVELAGGEHSPLQRAYVEWSCQVYGLDVPEPHASIVINHFVRAWGHQFIYDEQTLRAALEGAGFTRITRVALLESQDVALRQLENEARMPPGYLRLETLTLEGRK